MCVAAERDTLNSFARTFVLQVKHDVKNLTILILSETTFGDYYINEAGVG